MTLALPISAGCRAASDRADVEEVRSPIEASSKASFHLRDPGRHPRTARWRAVQAAERWLGRRLPADDDWPVEARCNRADQRDMAGAL